MEDVYYEQQEMTRIFLTGGGTGGSVMPLLAIYDRLRYNRAYEFIWIGTRRGPEREMVGKEKIDFHPIMSGKLRRYWSWENLIDPFFMLAGFIQSIYLLWRYRPRLVLSAGGFVSVPIVWAAWLLRIPAIIHQQDARPGLSNKLMAPFARSITVTFESSLSAYGEKAVLVGNPVRSAFDRLPKIYDARSSFGLNHNLPTLLVLGGGTGAAMINQLVWEGLRELTKSCQIIHVTGRGKRPSAQFEYAGYQCLEFLDVERMKDAYVAADIVISRCGLGVLTELSFLGKPSILIPMPDSHQEDNAYAFFEKKAAIILDQNELDAEALVKQVRKLLADPELREKLSRNIRTVLPKDGANKLLEVIKKVLHNRA